MAAPPARVVIGMRWHRAGAARTPVLVAVVRLPSTWDQLDAAGLLAGDVPDRPLRCRDLVWRQGGEMPR